jgi:hypothetical protein
MPVSICKVTAERTGSIMITWHKSNTLLRMLIRAYSSYNAVSPFIQNLCKLQVQAVDNELFNTGK